MSSFGALRGEPRFVRWAVAETVSIAGTMQTTVALPILVYRETGSAASTGALTAIRVLPYLLFGLLAGPLADRGNRRVLIIGGNVMEGVLVTTIPIAAAFDALTLTQVYAVALLSATAFVFSDAAVFGAVPALVGRDRIAAANGLLGSLGAIAEIAGPVLAGVSIALVGVTGTIAIDAVTFLVAAAVQSTIRGNFRPDGDAAREPGSARAQLLRAARFIRHHATLRTLLVVGFGNSFAYGIVIGLLVPFAVRQLGLTDDDGRIGVLYAAVGLGGLIAGLTLPRLFRVDRVPRIVPVCLAIAALGAGVLLAATNLALAAAPLVLLIAALSVPITVGITYRQTVSPDDLRSTVNVIGRMIAWGGQPFGAVAGAAVAESTSVPTAYATAGLLLVVCAAGSAVAFRRQRPVMHVQ